ncbi:MAG: glycosyltransferase family 4 protein [Elainellaceae cyanobacterium]
MKVLQIHNAYQHVGGEEVVVESEKNLLLQYGHEVKQWILHNTEIPNSNISSKFSIAVDSVWSTKSIRQIKEIVRDFEPDITHVHNTIPQISPSVYAACKSLNVPVVHTVHNYKLICPGAYLYRDGKICEECVGKFFPTPAVVHGCYRGNRAQTAVVTAGLVANRIKKTYSNDIDIYIALTRFARQKLIDGGLPAEKIAIKPNFVSSNVQKGSHSDNYALFVGKMVKYKGIETILRAWELLRDDIPLKVIGQGPLEIVMKSNLPQNVEYLGRLPREEVLRLMQNAKVFVFPSEWYEGFPMAIVEAFATASPVVAANCGAAGEIVKDGISGWHFEPGNHHDLARVVQDIWSDSDELKRRGTLARKQYDECYAPERNYEMLMSIYSTAIEWTKGRKSLSVF